MHTGSRKVSRTTFPRRLARLTGRPCWLVSVNAGALKSSGALDPSIAWARIGEALALAAAVASGMTPMMAMPSAPMAPRVRGLALLMRAARRSGRSRSRQPRSGPDEVIGSGASATAGTGTSAAEGAGAGASAGTAADARASARAGASTRARYPPTATSANGIMLLGSVPSPPNTPRS